MAGTRWSDGMWWKKGIGVVAAACCLLLGAVPGTGQVTHAAAAVNHIHFKAVSAGDYHTCGVAVSDEAIVCWGNDTYGEAPR